MKMKEVIEKTGLTDRAIRLYIDEGLALPNIEESYSGRKSINFSEGDVERLKNVALLRKAGFSIAEIKRLIDDETAAKDVVEKFIAETEKNIAEETEIVERLKKISFDEDVTFETICESLSETVEEKQVPKEDIKLTVAEKIAKLAIIALSGVFALQAIWMFANCCAAVFDVRYIKLTDNPEVIIGSLFYLVWAAIAILLITVIFKNIGKRFNRKTNGSSFALLILSVIGSVVMLLITLFLLWCTITPFYSQTTDPENYLEFDKSLMSEDERYNTLDSLYKIFPRKIPSSAKEKHPDSIKYFYEYTPWWDGYYGTYDVCTEWVLSDNEYEKAKNNLPDNFMLENRLIEIQNMDKNKYRLDYLTESAIKSSDYNIVKKGDWTLIYYKGYGKVLFDYYPAVDKKSEKCDDELRYSESKNEFEIENWESHNNGNRHRTRYDFLICAYNDKEQKIRYIASNCCGHANREGGPYYLSLDW